MKKLVAFLLILGLSNVVLAQPAGESRAATWIVTQVFIYSESYIVKWAVSMLAIPGDGNVFKDCAAEIRETLIARVIDQTQKKMVIDNVQDDFQSVCAGRKIVYEARPVFQHREMD